jgi:hypothetical protein
MSEIPFFKYPTSAKPARLRIYRASDGVLIWDQRFLSYDPIPKPPIDLHLREYDRWGGVKVRVEWSE